MFANVSDYVRAYDPETGELAQAFNHTMTDSVNTVSLINFNQFVISQEFITVTKAGLYELDVPKFGLGSFWVEEVHRAADEEGMHGTAKMTALDFVGDKENKVNPVFG